MAKIKAKHAGRCADCGQPFVAGAAIRWWRSTGTLCAEPCGERKATVRETAADKRKRIAFAVASRECPDCGEHGVPTDGRNRCGPCGDKANAAHHVAAIAAIVVAKLCRKCGGPTEEGTVWCAPCHSRMLAEFNAPADDFAEGIARARAMLAGVLS